jgi:hypothetical protein
MAALSHPARTANTIGFLDFIFGILSAPGFSDDFSKTRPPDDPGIGKIAARKNIPVIIAARRSPGNLQAVSENLKRNEDRVIKKPDRGRTSS